MLQCTQSLMLSQGLIMLGFGAVLSLSLEIGARVGWQSLPVLAKRIVYHAYVVWVLVALSFVIRLITGCPK